LVGWLVSGILRVRARRFLWLCADLKLLGAMTDDMWDGQLRRRWRDLAAALKLALQDHELAAPCSTALRSIPPLCL
jgi:hypothetical protein